MPDEETIRAGARKIGQSYVDLLNQNSELDIETLKSKYREWSNEAFVKLDKYLDSDEGTKDDSLRTNIAEEVLTRTILRQYNAILAKKGVKI